MTDADLDRLLGTLIAGGMAPHAARDRVRQVALRAGVPMRAAPAIRETPLTEADLQRAARELEDLGRQLERLCTGDDLADLWSAP